MTIAYLVNQYPAVSHSFIRREICAMETHGASVRRYSIRTAQKEQLVDPLDQGELIKATALFTIGLWGLIREGTSGLYHRPWRALSALWPAWKLGRVSHVGLLRHFIYWLEAVILAHWFVKDSITHIHAHFGTNSATVAMLAAKISGLPFSFTVHGPEEFDRPHAWGLADKIKAAKFTVAISSYGRSQLMRLVPHQLWGRLHVVHCGLGPDFLDHTPPPVPQHKEWLTVGRFTEQKGQILLIEAFAALKDEEIEPELIMVGTGPLEKDLKAAVEKYGLSSQIRFTGALSSTEIAALLDGADAFILPSFAEGLPVVLMEAFAHARPVVSSYVAGIPELVHHGKNGWLVPAGDKNALVSALKELWTTPADRLDAMGKEGRKSVLKNHNAVLEAERLKSLIENEEKVQ